MTRPDRKLAAALILSIGIGMTSVQDAFIKQLSGAYPFSQMQTIRCGLALLLIVGFLAARRDLGLLAVRPSPLLIFRGFILAFASTLFYVGLAAISLTDSSAIYFTMPLMVAALSGALIGERVHYGRWLAAAAGFVGVLVTIGPGSSVFEPAALVSLAATVLYAVGHMLARPLGDRMSVTVMAFYQCAAFAVMALVVAAIFGSGYLRSDAHVSLSYLTRPWVVPTTWDTAILAGTAAATAVGMFIYSSAYRLAQPSFVAPFEYTSIFWAIAMGYLLFADLPKSSTLTGAAIIIAAGLFLIWYERRSNPKLAAQLSNE